MFRCTVLPWRLDVILTLDLQIDANSMSDNCHLTRNQPHAIQFISIKSTFRQRFYLSKEFGFLTHITMRNLGVNGSPQFI